MVIQVEKVDAVGDFPKAAALIATLVEQMKAMSPIRERDRQQAHILEALENRVTHDLVVYTEVDQDHRRGVGQDLQVLALAHLLVSQSPAVHQEVAVQKEITKV